MQKSLHLLSLRSKATRYFCNSSKLFNEKFITAPIFYVNSKAHLGHLYTTVMADSLKRYYELKQIPSTLSVGTDEHGLKIQQAAETAGAKDPKTFCDEVSKDFYNLFKVANISYTRFIRTTDGDHKIAVQHFWNRLMERGWIYKGFHEGWYSVSDETFVPDSQIETINQNGEEIKVGKLINRRFLKKAENLWNGLEKRITSSSCLNFENLYSSGWKRIQT